jgi:uncharacterized protein YvpB
MEDLSIKKLARISMLILALFAYYNFYLKSSVLEVGSIQKKWDNNNPFAVYQEKQFLGVFNSFSHASAHAKKYEKSYIYYYKDKKLLWTNTKQLKESVILNAPMISQMPELARGCEVTSLAMMLQSAGVKADKMTLAKEIKKDPTPYKKKNGKIYYGHPNVGFVGDIYTFDKMGYGVYHKPIKELADNYLPGKVIDLTGCHWEDILYFLNQGSPVWVISNGSFKELPDSYFQEWHTPNGKIRITMKEHSVLVKGYDKDYVYINNPLKDKPNQKVSMKDFYASWKQMGRQAISYVK